MDNLGTFGAFEYLIKSFMGELNRFFKFQIITKLIFVAIFSPVFWAVTQFLISSRGEFALSNSGIIKFIFTPQGFILLLFGIAFISISILIEIFGTIAISSRIIKNQSESNYFSLLKYNFKTARSLIDPGIIFLLIYLVVLIPLTGAGTSISFLQRIKIPNFVTSVIFGNPKYLIIYGVVIFVMATVSLFTIFSFHFIVIGRYSPSKAVAASVNLVRKNLGIFIKKFLGILVITSLIMGAIIVFWLLGISKLVHSVDMNKEWTRVLLVFLYFVQEFGLRILALFFVPFEVHHITIVFYRLVSTTPEYSHLANQYPVMSEKSKLSVLDKVLARKKTIFVFLFAIILLLAVPMGIYFNEAFRYERSINIIGHRGGGGGHIPENSISSIKQAITYGAEYVEIDIQRTYDGNYILNHDNTFNRMAGNKNRAQDLTLIEIKKLDIGYKYPGYIGERVPTLEEVLDTTKNKIGIYLELKGVSADTKMADDVVKLIKERDMLDQIVFMSLDYNLVNYIETTYPNAETGYIYYLAVGDSSSFNADVIIMEESMINNSTLTNLYFSGKLPVVWTVNEMTLLEKYIEMGLYGVITDNVKESKATVTSLNKESDNDYLLKMFLKFE